jgi:phosphoribosylaminoimidazolecarboxamide formyltransferase/IMP cyclohydrolase
MASDGYLPFRDNIDYAATGGVTAVVEPGGSRRTPEVQQTAHDLGIRHITTGLRLSTTRGRILASGPACDTARPEAER